MPAQVTLHVYSGRPDPTWELSNDQINELAEKLRSITKTTLQKPAGIAGGLGYRGFSIFSSKDPRIERFTYVHRGIVDQERLTLNLDSDSEIIEQWLLNSAGEALDSNIRNFVQSEISKKGLVEFGIMPAPIYDPGRWNNDSTILLNNNCYNYANDKITNTFAQPGRGSGTSWSQLLSCQNDVSPAAQRDGQIIITNPDITLSEGHIIALVLGVGYDYHWYRRDTNGFWSHKPGQTQARNYDNSNNRINDPRYCDRGPYEIFCGFFHCLPSMTRII